MGLVREQLAKLRIESVSPDETVIVVLTAFDINVELASDVAEVHTVESLEQEIESSLTHALTSYVEATEQIRSESQGEKYVQLDVEDLPPRRRRYREACDGIAVDEMSERKYVSMQWYGRDDIMIVLRDDALTKLDHQALSKEINSVVSKAAKSRIQQLRKLQKMHLERYQLVENT